MGRFRQSLGAAAEVGLRMVVRVSDRRSKLLGVGQQRVRSANIESLLGFINALFRGASIVARFFLILSPR